MLGLDDSGCLWVSNSDYAQRNLAVEEMTAIRDELEGRLVGMVATCKVDRGSAEEANTSVSRQLAYCVLTLVHLLQATAVFSLCQLSLVLWERVVERLTKLQVTIQTSSSS